jgi:nitroreductase
MNNDLSHLEELLSNRKIVRSYKKVNFDTEPLKNIASYSIKIPTAGFSRGIEVIQVFNTETIDEISNLFHEQKYIEEGKDPWISNSVALFFILLNEDAYHQRYSKSDKAKAVNSKDWDVPYWFVDAGASMMNSMLLIEERGLSSGFMGIHNTDRKEVNKLLNIPENYLVIGLITAGVENDSTTTKSNEIKRKKLVHYEKFSK